MRLRNSHSRELVSVPSFALGGSFAPLHEPFRAPISIASAGRDAVVLRTSLCAAEGFSIVPVHWEIARDPSFITPERYGLLLAHEHAGFDIEVSLNGLERGRSYWARLWAGGTWSRAVRVRTGPRANGSSSLALRSRLLRQQARRVQAD
ncbi:MAG TPA: PhoD-like phosphatase N-terminal domain-containing protein [Polyangiales bacterium]|nr:PhoD-like phosphatase N-terminal domain-containing protein [Polyangiales bacterium]